MVFGFELHYDNGYPCSARPFLSIRWCNGSIVDTDAELVKRNPCIELPIAGVNQFGIQQYGGG